MESFIVVDNPERWRLKVEGVRVISALQYLSDPEFSTFDQAKVFNLCASYRYQTYGYYVSLVAAARGHYPIPSVTTIQDMGLSALAKKISSELEEEIQQCLRNIQSEEFELSVYFGKNLAKSYDKLAKLLFGMCPAPFLRAFFKRYRNGGEHWKLDELRLIAAGDIPETHHAFVTEQIQAYLKRPVRHASGRQAYRYELAILYSGQSPSPSDADAIAKFREAADDLDMNTTIIGKKDYANIPRFDAMFIRDTTRVNHYTYRFARRAQLEGLVVIDDPTSILRCCNKIYLYELLKKKRIPVPRSTVITKETIGLVDKEIGYPCVVKLPDSSFSCGVFKYANREALEDAAKDLFRQTDMLLIQEYVPSDFDWRIGVLGGRPLFACKYYMAKDHWQIVNNGACDAQCKLGNFETLSFEDVPPAVLKNAVASASLIGDGLYGVDVKSIKGKPLVIEINDNPNLDEGVEDKYLGDELYHSIMRTFYYRLEKLHGKS